MTIVDPRERSTTNSWSNVGAVQDLGAERRSNLAAGVRTGAHKLREDNASFERLPTDRRWTGMASRSGTGLLARNRHD